MDGEVIIGTKLDTGMIDKQLVLLQDKLEGLMEEYQILESAEPFEGQAKELIKLGNEINTTKKKMETLRKEKEKLNKGGFENILSSLNSVGNSISKTINKVGRWALAVFGIRSAYLAVRSAMSTLSQYDEQMATNVEYIRYLLASTLKPIIETLIQLAYKLLTYINYISQAWFGVNLFANASTKAFEKQNKALGGSVKQAKQLQKTLAGFDEMNVLQDNGDTTSGGGGGGTTMPSLPNFPAMEDVPIPSWLQWIVDNGSLVATLILGIGTALTLMKFGLDPLLSLGIGALLMGIIFLIQDIIDFINDPSWKNFIAVLGDVAIVIGGIMLIMGNWWGLLVVIIGLIVKVVSENWDTIKNILIKVWDWINQNVVQPIYNLFKPLFDFFISLFSTIWNNIKTIVGNWVTIFKTVFNSIKTIFSPIVNFFGQLWGKVKDKFISFATTIGSAVSGVFKTAVNGVLGMIENFLNAPINAINALIDVINAIPGINLGRLSTFNFPRLAKGGIINQPGRGVMVGGSAIAGERGREGVIPLTDSQQMALLGEAIGKYITINANITNTMNGRVISRELQRVQNDSDFAFNR